MSRNFRSFINGITLIPNGVAPTGNTLGDLYVNGAALSPANVLNFHNGTTASPVLTITHSATLLSAVQNKDLDSSSVRFIGIGAGGTNLSNPSSLAINVNGGAVNTTTTLDFNQTVNRTITFPDITDTVVTQTASQNLTNKTFNAYSAYFPPSSPNPNTVLTYDGSVYKWDLTGGAESGGANDDVISTQYQARILDTFEQTGAAVNTTASTIDSTKTTATWDSVNQYYEIEYNNNITVTAVTPTRMQLSAAPVYPTGSLAVGDILVIKSTGEARRITATLAGNQVDIESAFTSLPAASPCLVSQTVSTFDVYNSNFDGVAISTAFTATPTFQNYLVDYEDNTGATNVYIPNTTPKVAFSASNDIITPVWSNSTLRPINQTSQINGNLFPSVGDKLFIRFFANPNLTPAGSGTVNLLSYRGYMQLVPQAVTYSVNQAYARLNGSGTPYQCTVDNTNPSYTQITLNWTYAFGTTTGLPYGAIDVFINGQFIPKQVAGTTDPSAAFYTEVSSTVIRLDQNYGSTPYAIQIIQRGNI
jgi:hypothetical protein